MIGQVIANKKYNVIILAGGAGVRMGEQSDYIPKALSLIGNKRAIDYTIERYSLVAHKFIIGTCYHAELLESYVKGRFPNSPIVFSREEFLQNNAVSTLFCLDNADSRFGTIVVFCDLIVTSNNVIHDDTFLYTTPSTQGKIGTFRHNVINNKIIKSEVPYPCGVLGYFCFGNTFKLKSLIYSTTLTDLTDDIVIPYGLEGEECKAVYEFGNEEDLKIVREIWEKT